MIKAENVNYIYQQGMPFERQALYDVNIEIEDGSLVALIGHTGSGKSTLIQHFNALVKPTSGKIIINGIDVTAPKADLRLVRKTVGLVFQYPEHQLFEETVYKDIAFGPKNMGFSDEEIDKRVRESAALVGLKEKHLTRSPFDLSGGQKRRVAIAGVLAMNPKVLILDEPTAGLDPKERARFRNILSTLSKDRIVILSTHIVSDIESNANQVILLKERKLYRMDTVSNICKTLDGKVYECVMEDRAFDAFQDTHLILSVRQEQEHMQVRYYSSKPEEGSRNCTPNLEDVFLVTYQEEPA